MSSLFRAMVVSHNRTRLRGCRRYEHGAQRGELSSPTSATHPGDRRQPNRQDRWIGSATSTVFVSNAHAKRAGELRSRQRTTPASSHSPADRLDVVGGAAAHPDELPRRVMTTHPAAVDAGSTTASGGSVEARKYRTCGHGCVRRGAALKGTRPDGAAPSRRSRIWSSRASRGWVIEQGLSLLPHRFPAAGPCLTRASGSQPHCVPILFAMAGT
jgi:hypothetical protein